MSDMKSRVYSGLWIAKPDWSWGNKKSLCRELKESRQILKSAKMYWILTKCQILGEKDK